MALVLAIDWTTLRALPASRTGKDLRLHTADLLFQVRLRDTRVLLYFLIEHKSTLDPDTEHQLIRYVVHILEALPERRERRSLLFVPLLVYHGRRPWQRPTHRHLRRRLAPIAPEAVAALLERQAELRFFVDDLTSCGEADLLRRELTALGRLTVLCLRFVRWCSDDEALAAVERWSDIVRAVAAEPGGQDHLHAIWCYIAQVTDLTFERLAATVARVLHHPVEDSVMSTYDRVIAKGRTEGRTEGRAEGRTEGQAMLILRQLTARFGSLPDHVVARITAGTTDDLERWADRILDARSLADVLGTG